MAKLPEFQPNLIPEGHYNFEIIEEPEVRITGASKWMIFRFKIVSPDGNSRKFSDVFFPGDEKYRKLLFLAGAQADEKGIPHLKDMDTKELVGLQFEADIIHAPDKKDASKVRDTISEITSSDEDVPPPSESEEEDEVPF